MRCFVVSDNGSSGYHWEFGHLGEQYRPKRTRSSGDSEQKPPGPRGAVLGGSGVNLVSKNLLNIPANDRNSMHTREIVFNRQEAVSGRMAMLPDRGRGKRITHS